MARGKQQAEVWVATETFFAEGESTPIRKGETRVRDGHPLLKAYPDYFEPADENVHFDVEQATAAPGEKRGTPREVKASDANEPKTAAASKDETASKQPAKAPAKKGAGK